MSNTSNIENQSKVKTWLKAAPVSEFPENGGESVLMEGEQIAIFNFTRRGEWYAVQNLCPHKQEMLLARGMIGSTDETIKVACPLHKNNFCLKTGKHLNGDLDSIKTYPVRVENGYVYVGIQ